MNATSLILEPRQETTDMDVVLFDLGQEETVIHCEGNMSEYGKVYGSFRLKYNSDRLSGFFTSQGRGVVDENTTFAGAGVGTWTREGSKIQMTEVDLVDNGTQNLYKMTLDTMTKKLSISAYIIK